MGDGTGMNGFFSFLGKLGWEGGLCLDAKGLPDYLAVDLLTTVSRLPLCLHK